MLTHRERILKVAKGETNDPCGISYARGHGEHQAWNHEGDEGIRGLHHVGQGTCYQGAERLSCLGAHIWESYPETGL